MIAKMDATRKMFIENIISGKIDAIKNTEAIKDEVWSAMIALNVSLYQSAFTRFFAGKSEYECTPEEKDEAKKKVEELSVIHQMLIALHNSIGSVGDIADWNGVYKEEVGIKLKKGYAVLEKYGWSFEEEDEKLINGTHELYAIKEEVEEEEEEEEEEWEDEESF